LPSQLRRLGGAARRQGQAGQIEADFRRLEVAAQRGADVESLLERLAGAVEVARGESGPSQVLKGAGDERPRAGLPREAELLLAEAPGARKVAPIVGQPCPRAEDARHAELVAGPALRR